jgi:peroxiredoxin
LPAFSQAQLTGNGSAEKNTVPLQNGVDSFSYALGMNVSSFLVQQGVTEFNIGVMTQAMMDLMSGKPTQMTAEFGNAFLQQKIQELSQKKQQSNDSRTATVGKVIPDFQQADPNGKMVSIQSFRGQYVLIDFWASWCGPCRQENPNVVKAYNRFKDKGFTVLGISLDKSKEPWLEAVRKDKLTWTQVSDLKFWSNAVAQQFGINSIPQNFLIDPNGIVIDKNLRGAALEDRLEQLFGK